MRVKEFVAECLYTSRDRAGRIISEVTAPAGTSAAFVPMADVLDAARSFHGDNKPYGITTYEQSPPGRVLTSTGPGKAWHDAGKAVRTDYFTNENNDGAYGCLCFDITDSRTVIDTVMDFKCTGRYAAGTLFVTRTEDEDGHISMEFKDKDGHTVLLRRAGSMTDAADRSKRADTYFVYDVTGRLTAVMQPMMSKTMTVGRKLKTTHSMFGRYAYLYIYDDRGRVRGSKLPGCTWTLVRRDGGGQAVYSQDGNMRRTGKALLSLSDELGRPCVTAVAAATFSLADGALADVVKVRRNILGDISTGMGGYHVLNSALSVGNVQLLKSNYCDSYSFLDGYAGKSDLEYRDMDGYDSRWVNADAPAQSAKGQRTGSLTNVLGTDRMLCEAVYYDVHGNIIQRHAENDMGGAEHYYYRLSFTGKPLAVRHVHVTSDTIITEEHLYTYDHAERPLTESVVRDGVTVPMVANSYDELGRQVSVQYGTSGYNKVTTARNVRGWTTAVSGPMFSQTIHYQDGYGDAAGCWNGNVSAMEWTAQDYMTSPGSVHQCYSYGYDGLNRLVSAAYSAGSDGIMPMTTAEYVALNDRDYSCTYSYDVNGNVTSLRRKGIASAVDDGGTNIYITYGDIDDLSLTYDGNRLSKVSDAADALTYAGAMDFRDGADVSVEYTYDANGNMTVDLNKGINLIRYNVLNLPGYVQFADGHSVTYTYDADGNKLRTVSGVSGVSVLPGAEESPITPATLDDVGQIEGPVTVLSTWEYCGGHVYMDGRLERTLQPWGYTDADGADYFYITDYLGNVRTVTDRHGYACELNAYYPYGALMNTLTGNGTKQPYKYGGKELDRTAGLDLYDSQARFYDPVLCRTTTVDPKSAAYAGTSHYAWCAGNPTRYVDPDGRDYGVVAYDDRIEIIANIYTSAKDYESAKIGCELINSNSNMYYVQIKTENDVKELPIIFIANPIETEITMINGRAQQDDYGNAYFVKPDSYFQENENGRTIVRNIAVKESRSKTSTTGHEIGHAMGSTHHSGLMSESSSARINNNFDIDTVKEIIKYSIKDKQAKENGIKAGKGHFLNKSSYPLRAFKKLKIKKFQ